MSYFTAAEEFFLTKGLGRHFAFNNKDHVDNIELKEILENAYKKETNLRSAGMREYIKREFKTFKLKNLTGSAAQKEWAEQIRYEILTSRDEHFHLLNYPIYSYTEIGAKKLKSLTSAKFWIENRNKSIYEILGAESFSFR